MCAAWLPVFGETLVSAAGKPTGISALAAKRHETRTAVVEQPSFDGGKGVALRDGVEPLVGSRTDHTPELVFEFRAEKPGRYRITAYTAADDYGKTFMTRWRKEHPTYYAKLRVDEQLPTIRNAFSPWRSADKNETSLGNFNLTGKPQRLALQLPRGIRLEKIEFRLLQPPKAPPAMLAYRPRILPPANRHPRVWFNPEALEKVRANLQKEEHRPLYEKIKAAASGKTPDFDPDWEMVADSKLEEWIANRAFVALMENDRKLARAAADLMGRYLQLVEFGNMMDVTRPIGQTIYTASLVYDWCYDVMTPEERAFYREKMLSFASDMEVGWPPAQQTIVNGHGNESQMCRDLLTMAIAVYDEDPEPYRYLAWQVLENLVPMRTFEYVSPRHNQGTNYGYLRYQSDLYAAWLFERMTGRHVFDDNFFRVIDFWTYMRLPDKEMFPCGDGAIGPRYWKYPLTTMFAQAGRKSAQLKGEMVRQGSLEAFPLLALILNDPDLKPDLSFDTLPLTIDFGPVLGGMVARTGWDIAEGSSDVVAEIRGGGYNFANHQHSDAGALQIYYRGWQIVDLGQYRFYGTPYDFGFAKRSVAHSMMLVTDPAEKFLGDYPNDGGIQLNQQVPVSPRQVRSEPTFQRGKVLAAAFGPERMKPRYSFFAVDLTGAYSAKIEKYVRSFVFLNFEDEKHPAAIVLFDHVRAAKADFRKELQFNTAATPEVTPDGFITSARNRAGVGRTHLDLLLPAAADRTMTVKQGRDALTVGGRTYVSPLPEQWQANGCRVLFSPVKAQKTDEFLTVLQPTPDGGAPYPVSFQMQGDRIAVFCGPTVTVLNRTGGWFDKPVEVELPAGRAAFQVTVTGLAAGKWSDGKTGFDVAPGKHAVCFDAEPGTKVTLTPQPPARPAR